MADLGSSKVFGDLTVTGFIVNPTLEAALGGKAESTHTHDGRYYTEAEIDAMFAGFTTTPDWTAVSNKPATATRWPAWTEVTSKPTTFSPSAHTHSIADVSGLQTELDGKAAASHTHAYLPLAGGTLTGPLTVKNVREGVYVSPSLAFLRSNGGFQFHTLTASGTMTIDLVEGESMTIHLIGGDTHSVTWPTTTWIGGVPILTANSVVAFWKANNVLFGSLVGDY